MNLTADPEVLEEAVKLLGPLDTDKANAARFLLTMFGEVSGRSRITFRETMQTLSKIRELATQLERCLKHVSFHTDELKALGTLVGPLITGSRGRELVYLHPESEFLIDSAGAARVISTRAGEAITELERYRIPGGPDSFAARIGFRQQKRWFLEQCSDIWFLTGNSFERGSRSEFIRFLELAYEFSTGDVNGGGIRDWAPRVQQDTLERYGDRSGVECHIAVLEVFAERLGRVDDVTRAELTLLRGYLSRTI
jgi:hypothetical protein